MCRKTVLNRAYSLVQFKAIEDAESRTIRGLATSPEPDRVGDVIEPKGAKFKNPLPLLLHHDTRMPVGSAKFAKPTEDGIEFEASFPTIDEPGTLKDRVDEAWQSIKAGLIRGVSIGFRVMDDGMERLKSGGVRFTKTEILELSLVVIPANSHATITALKSIAYADLAALGQVQTGVTRPSAGVTAVVKLASKGASKTMRTYTERIKDFENTRAAKWARIEEIQTKASDEGQTKTEAEREEFDSLKLDVKNIDAELVDLRELEAVNATKAIAVVGATVAVAAASRGGVVVVPERLEKGIEFVRYAMCLAAAKGNTTQALEIAKIRFPTMSRIHTVLKAAVGAGTTTDPTWAGTLVDYTNFTGDFIDYLRPQTILGKFGTGNIPSLTRIPFNVRIQGQTSGGDGYWVGQGQAKPLTSFDFAPTTLTWAKVANIAVLTDELVRFSSPSAEMLVRQALADALIARLDTDFVDPTKTAVTGVSPASITNGVTPIQTSGSSEADVRIDVAAIFAPYITANNTSLSSMVWIMSTSTALSLSLMTNALGQPTWPSISMTGGTFVGIPVIVSDYVANIGSPSNDLVILVNAKDIYLADDGQVTIDASREASLEMSSTPTMASAATGSPYAPTGTSVVSMFQTNSIALRAERYINWAKRRTEAVQYLDNVIWGRGGGSA